MVPTEHNRVTRKEALMLQIIIFMLVLALAYVIKAGSIMLSHEELAADSTAFSWVHASADEEGATPIWATEETEKAPEPAPARVPVAGFRRVNA